MRRLYSASASNNRGQIADDGCYIAGPKNGQCYAFVVIPKEEMVIAFPVGVRVRESDRAHVA
jgi:hypothetical protein